jgi:adenylate cyclase
LIGIEKVIGEAEAGPVAAPKILYELDQVGANDIALDSDGKVRRGLMYLDRENGETVFSLSLRLALLYLETYDVLPEVVDQQFVKLGQAVFLPFQANDGGYVNADDQGYQILLNYRGAQGHFRTVSMADVLNDRVSPEWIRDRIVLIGTTAESIKDYVQTPYSGSVQSQSLQRMSGVEVKANLTSQIISAALDGRRNIRNGSDPGEWLWILLWSLIGATLAWEQRTGNRSMQARWFKTSLNILLAGLSLMLIGFLLFVRGWWIPVVPPMLGMMGSAAAVTAYLAQMATEVRRTFGRYLTDEVVTTLLETPTELQLVGEKRKISILMSDLRGFSAISENLPAEWVVKLLNLYLEAMTEVINRYGGSINQVIGDGLVVFFGVLKQKPDDAERAVACAIAMQLAMETVNQKNQQLDLPLIEMGIGINTGEVVVGNIGSLKHAQFTAIGNHVNVASRIESFSVGGQVLISQSTLDDILAYQRSLANSASLDIKRRSQGRVKGMHNPITLYDISGISGEYNLFLPQVQTELVTLPESVPVRYTLIEGKQVVGNALPARLVKLSLSTQEAELATGQAIALLSNLRLNLLIPATHELAASDIYAKVTDITSDTHVRIRFTNMSSKMAVLLLGLAKKSSPPSGTETTKPDKLSEQPQP